MTNRFLFLSSTQFSINVKRNVKNYKLTSATFDSLVWIQESNKNLTSITTIKFVIIKPVILASFTSVDIINDKLCRFDSTSQTCYIVQSTPNLQTVDANQSVALTASLFHFSNLHEMIGPSSF
jgi:hypothetical protein